MLRGSAIGYSELAAELVGLKVDIILVAGGDVAIRAAKNATKHDSHRYDGRWVRSCRRQVLLKALPVPAATSPALQTLTRT